MKFYNIDNGVDVDVDIAKALLELPEDEFCEYENFIKDFNSLVRRKGYNYLDFKNACEIFLSNKKIVSRLYKKLYRDFILKYSIFIKKFTSSLNYNSIDKIYKLLKVTYRNKDAILERMTKLSEIGIHNFLYVFEPGLNDNLVKCDSINKIIDIATDGDVTYERNNGPYCYVNIRNAKYILEYSKEVKYGWTYADWTMIVSNLMFDASTLPTYEQLNDFNIKPAIDFEEAKRQGQINEQRQDLIDHVLYVDDTLGVIQDLKERLEKLISGMGNNYEGFSEGLLQKIQELYTELETYKSQLINQSVDDSLMSEDEINTAIKVKKKKSNRPLSN